MITNLNTLPDDKAFIELTELVKSGQIVVFAGSGLSSRYHPNDVSSYPAWWELVRDLCTSCSVKCDETEITSSTYPIRLQELASLAKQADLANYTKIIVEHFSKSITDRRESYNLLMDINFKAYVTTNYDPQLAQAATRVAKTPKEIRAYPEIDCSDVALQRVIYLHGYVEESSIPKTDRLVLAKEDFQIAYGDERNEGLLRLFWKTLLNDYNVLFLGCELGEPELSFCFEQCNFIRKSLRDQFGRVPKKRFILLNQPANPSFDSIVPKKDQLLGQDKKSEIMQRLANFDVTPVIYDPIDRRHVGLINILKYWAPPRQTPRLLQEGLQ